MQSSLVHGSVLYKSTPTTRPHPTRCESPVPRLGRMHSVGQKLRLTRMEPRAPAQRTPVRLAPPTAPE